MKSRRVLFLTESECGTLRSALRTAMEEDCGAATANRQQRLLDKLANAPVIPQADWIAYQDAAGEMLEAGDEPESHIGADGVRRCYRFAETMNKAFSK